MRQDRALPMCRSNHSFGGAATDVAGRLGHKDASVTLKVYAHLMPDDDSKLAIASEALLA